MKKKLVLLLICIITCCALVATTLVACNNKDTWTFTVEGVNGYSDAIVDAASKTVSVVVQSSTNIFDLNNIKIPATLSYSAKNADKKAVTGNIVLLNSGENTYYMTFKGDVDVSGKKHSVDVEWTIKIKRLSSDISITNVEIDTFKTTYNVGEAFAGGKIKITYADESSVLIDINPIMVTGFNTAEAGSHTVTIKYDGYTFERVISVIDPESEKFEEVTPTVITKIDDALNTFARLGAILSSGATEGAGFNERKDNFLKTLNENKAEMKSFLESIGVTDANIDSIATIADKIAPIVNKIVTVANTGENYEQLYTQEFIAEFQVVAKDILGVFSSSQLTLATEKIANSFIEKSLITESDYKKYTTPISDTAIAAKVLAQFEMWTDGDYRAFPLDKKDIFTSVASAKNLLNFVANIEPKKISTIVDTIIKIITMEDMSLENISTKNLKDTINYVGEIICGIDVSIVDKTAILSYFKDIIAFLSVDETSNNYINSIISSNLFDSKAFQVIGEVLMNLTADNVLEIFDIAKVFLTEEPANIEAEYGNIIHYVGRMVTPVIDKHYSSSEFISFLNSICDFYADFMNAASNVNITVNIDEMKKAVTDAYTLIYNASKKETLTTDEKAGLYNDIVELLGGVTTTLNPLHIEYYYSTVVLPVNITETDFYEYLNSKYGLYNYANGFRLPFTKEICSGIDLTKAGSQTMTIKVDEYTTTMKLYFVGDSNKGDFCFELDGVNTKNIDMKFALNSNPNDFQASSWRMYLVNRKDKVDYSLAIDYNNAKFIGVDTTSTGRKNAIVESTDWVFGTVYFPFNYYVYDPENPQVEHKYILINDFYLGLSDKLTGRLNISYDSGRSEQIELPDNIFTHLKKDTLGMHTGTVEYNGISYKVYYYIRDFAEYFRDYMYYNGYVVTVGTKESDLVFNIRDNVATLGEINAWLAERNLGSIFVEDFDSSIPGYCRNELFFKYNDGRTIYLTYVRYEVIRGYEYDVTEFYRRTESTETAEKQFRPDILTETDVNNLVNGRYDGFIVSFNENIGGSYQPLELELTLIMSNISDMYYGNARIDINGNVLYVLANNRVIAAHEFILISDADALKPRDYNLIENDFDVALGNTIEAVEIIISYGNNEILYAEERRIEPITPEQIYGINFNQVGIQHGTVTIENINYGISVNVY